MPETTTRPWHASSIRQALSKIGAQAFHERSDGAGLDPERFAPHLDQALAVGGVIHRFGRVIRMQSGIIHRPSGTL
jgi:hypothetical protein